MDTILNEVKAGWRDGNELSRAHPTYRGRRLGCGHQLSRETRGKPAGLRTHMLVAVDTALFVVACIDSALSASDLSRVIQRLATGIGFIGAGANLKLVSEREITGLTTAAGIWMTAAVGGAVGMGRLGAGRHQRGAKLYHPRGLGPNGILGEIAAANSSRSNGHVL